MFTAPPALRDVLRLASPRGTRTSRQEQAPASGAWWLHSDSVHAKLKAAKTMWGVSYRSTCGSTRAASRAGMRASIVVDGPATWLEDSGSQNGTWVNGRQVTARADVADGDEAAVWCRVDVPAMGDLGARAVTARGAVVGHPPGAGRVVRGAQNLTQ